MRGALIAIAFLAGLGGGILIGRAPFSNWDLSISVVDIVALLVGIACARHAIVITGSTAS